MKKGKGAKALGRAVKCTGMAAVTASLIAPLGVQAASHWLSGVTIKTPSQPDMVLKSTQAGSQELLDTVLMSTSATVEFDLTIALDSNPQGDDDYKTNGGAADQAQRAFEERIKEFAKAVYQSTNGAHKIRRVTIFRTEPGKTRVDSADVLWDENCASDKGPRANPSGFGNPGKHIWMCTNWSGSSSMSTPKGSGYTLAHEWGHYAYGLYDEYAQEQCSAANIAANTCWAGTPRGTDTAAIPAMMNNQWLAAAGNTDYLEFSTPNIHPFRSDSTGTNAQKRVFGESAWQTLTRDPATDPKFSWLPTRTQYTVLSAPTDPNWIVKDDESTALSVLDIRWAGNLVMDLSIDVSGSMYDTPLANAKTGANLLVDQVQPGTTAIGVGSFGSDVYRNFPIMDIPDPDTGVKASAKAAIDLADEGGSTSLYDGLVSSLNAVVAFDPARPSVVYVLSDGGDNDSSATEADVIAAYKAAGVAIISFAYGNNAPTGTLQNMANATGGAFFLSPTTVPEIQQALIAAQTRFSSNALVTSSTASAPGNTIATRTVVIDSTLASAQVNLSYSGAPTDFDFSLRSPSGTDTGATFVCEGNASCTATLDSAFLNLHGYGAYEVVLSNKTGADQNVTLLVTGAPSTTETYDITVAFSSNTVTYPADLALHATVNRGPAIARLDVTAIVSDQQQGNSFNVTLRDDGQGADQVPNDGTYSASIPYTTDGIYSATVTASNPSGSNAQTTFEGAALALREDGTAFVPTPTPITEIFTRTGVDTATVTSVATDDHSDNPAGGSCTFMSDNNVDTVGRIDFGGDVDCFTFVPSSTSAPIVVRATSLASGMDPILTVYDHTGTVQIREVNMSTSENPASGAIATIAAGSLDAAGTVFAVRHSNPAATIGNYEVSAGAPLPSDAPPPAANNGDVNRDGRVDALDVVATINAVLRLQTWPNADMNSDGAFDALDVVAVINRVLDI